MAVAKDGRWIAIPSDVGGINKDVLCPSSEGGRKKLAFLFLPLVGTY